MERRLLSAEEIKSVSQTLPGWELNSNKLGKNFEFKNFIEAFGFISKVAIVSESLGHHPELSNSYSKVNIQLTTHDLNGLSTLDIELAKAINNLL